MKSVFAKDCLEGKICLVTGGSRGGMLQEIATQFISHGAKAVVLMSRNQEKNIAVASAIGAHSIPGDVTKRADCERVVAQVIKKFGRLDVLVNGAAGNFLATAEHVSTNAIKRVIDIDTVGTFNMSQQAFKQAFK